MEKKSLEKYLKENRLIEIDYTCFMFAGCGNVAVLDTETDNVYYQDKFYTISKESIDNIKKVIEDTNIMNVKFNDKASNELFEKVGFIVYDCGMHYINIRYQGKNKNYKLEAVNKYNKYYKYVKAYEAGYEVVVKTFRELKKAGIELGNFSKI